MEEGIREQTEKFPSDLQNVWTEKTKNKNEYVWRDMKRNKTKKIFPQMKRIFLLTRRKKKKEKRETYKDKESTLYYPAPFSASGYKKLICKEF